VQRQDIVISVRLGVEYVCMHCPVYLIPFVVIIIVCQVTNRRHH